MPQINVRVEDAKHQRLLREARQQGVSVSELIRRALGLQEAQGQRLVEMREALETVQLRLSEAEFHLGNFDTRLSRIEEIAERAS